MCFGGGGEAKKARKQAEKDAKKMRREMQRDRLAMQREMAASRREMGRTAPAPNPYRIKDRTKPVGIKRKRKNFMADNISGKNLRIALNTGGGSTGGGINAG